MAAQTKAELLEGLGARTTKAELVELLGSKLKKDELASLLDDESGATKEELVRKLGARTKDDLVEAVGSHLSKDDLQKAVDERGPREDEGRARSARPARSDGDSDSDTDLDWSAELDWAPPPRPTPAPVRFVGAAPFMPGQRVRVDLAGLPMLGVFAGTVSDALTDLLDALVDTGVAAGGDVTISVAGVDLVALRLQALLASVGTAGAQGLDFAPRRRRPRPVPARLDTDADSLQQGLAQLVLAVVEILGELLERQALRRMAAGTLGDAEVRALGTAFAALHDRLDRLSEELVGSPGGNRAAARWAERPIAAAGARGEA